ncbi:hypothetical protein [Paenimyroides ceti]
MFKEESNIATLEEKEVLIKSFERINEVMKSTDKQKEPKQFDWGFLFLQILPVIIMIYFLYKIWKKIVGDKFYNK